MVRFRLAPALAVLAAALLVTAPVQAQPDPNQDRTWYDNARAKWEAEIPAEAREALQARWTTLAEQAARLSALVESIPADDPRRAQLEEYLKGQRDARMQGSGTLRGSHGNVPGTNGAEIGARNFLRADALIEDWARRGLPLTVERMQELNRVLGDGLQHNGRPPGTMRSQPNDTITAGGRFRYVPGRHVGEAMAEFATWYETSRAAGMAPAELAGKSYMRLVSIHPFWDGNGRTTRMIMNFILRSNGMPAVALQDVMVAVFAERPVEGVMAEKAARVVTEGLEVALRDQLRIAERAPTGFASARRGAAGPTAPSPVADAELTALFERVLEAARARVPARVAEASPVERVAVAAGARGLSGLTLEVVPTNDVLAEHAGDRVRISTGLLNAIEARLGEGPADQRAAARARILGLILAHEVSHGAGIRAERVADAEALRLLERAGVSPAPADLRAALDLFGRSGSPHVDGFFTRVRDLLRYGTPGGRLAELERAARGEVDRLAAYRRADGTLKWDRLVRDGALREAGGLAHFTLALFLKELAVVVQTGDRLRIEEFFDGLLTTDFFTHYGLFALGARGGEIAYVRYLQRHLRPGFVNSLLKTNMILMTGLALPQIVSGEFSGKTFMISVGSLGLSSSAVRAGVAGIRWVHDLRATRSTSLLARLGPAGRRIARAGGWVYTAAELAVVLYLGDAIAEAFVKWDSRRAAKRALGEAGDALLAALAEPGADVEAIRAAVRAHAEAWNDYRNFLYAPLHENEARLNVRLAKLAKRAKLLSDRRRGLVDRLDDHEHLAANVAERSGSAEAHGEHLDADELSDLRRDTADALEAYTRGNADALAEVYEANRRDDSLRTPEHLAWLLAGAPLGGAHDPFGARTDPFASWGRANLREDGLGLRDVSNNRLQAYEDQAALLAALAAALRARGRASEADVLLVSRAEVLRTLAADRDLVRAD